MHRGKRGGPPSCAPISLRLAAALVILSAGYILFEYRLFGEMLFSDVVTMRTTMARG